MTASTPTVSPLTRHHVTTDSVDEAHALLSSRYAEHQPKVSGSRGRFRFESSSAGTDHFGFERMTHSMTVEAWAEPLDALLVMRPAGGRFRMATRMEELRPGVGEPVLADPDIPGFVAWDAVRVGIVRLELAPTRKLFADMSGIAPGDVRFDMSRPLSPAHTKHWQADVRHVSDLMEVPEVAASALIRGEAYRMLATSLLHSFPNTALEAINDPTLAAAGRVDPPAVRRAIAFIDAHASEDIGPAEIAAAAGTSPRALQQAFRRHRDSSPLRHLRTVRMESAHRELQAADPTCGATVSTIARKWGFVHLGHFAAGYRARFGQTPSDTLRS